MGRIPDEIIAEIRERADIVAVIGEHMALKKAGASFKGLCPFHGEKTPSFNVSPQKRAYYCFGCQKKGDVFRFLAELKGLSFAEVVKELAQKTGVTIPERPETPGEAAARSERSRLFDVNATAAAFYRALLQDEIGGRKGRAYLESRGIGPAVAESFQLGLAPDAWDALATHLAARKLPVELVTQLGLIAPRQTGRGYYDKFRDRLMCPVILPAGEIVGFSGRTLGSDPETPKYVNSAESPIYKKSHLLFGLHAARPAFHRKGRALLVEGNFDVIALHQAGFDEAVAPLGTALTPEQIDKLVRLCPVVVLCLDGDKAGRAAALKDIPLCLAAGAETKVVVLPDGEDPDSFVRKHGVAALEELVKGALPAERYFIDQLWLRTDRSVDSRARALREVAPILASLRDETKRSMMIHDFARALDIPEGAIIAELRKVRPLGSPAPAQGAPHAATPAATPPPRPAAPPPRAELELVRLLSDHPDLLPYSQELDVRSLLTDSRLRDMYSAALSGGSFLDAAPPEIANLVATAVFAGSFKAVDDPRRALATTVHGLREMHVNRELAELKSQINDAQRRGDQVLARTLFQRQVELKSSKTSKVGIDRGEEPR